MQVKFSEDVIPQSDLKVNPGKVVSRAELIYPPSRIVYLRHSSAVSLVWVRCSERLLILPQDET